MKRSLVSVVSLSALALGCGDELDPGSRVTDFRLIAVRADKPYAAPGERVELTTLSHEPFGRPVTFGWATCVRPDDTTVNGCLDNLLKNAHEAGGPPNSVALESPRRTTVRSASSSAIAGKG